MAALSPKAGLRGLGVVVVASSSPSVFAAAKVGDEFTSHPLMAPGYAVDYLLGVVLVMIALGAFALLARRFHARIGGGDAGLRLRASLPLGGKERLVVVQVEDETLLLGVSPGCVQLVSKLKPSQAAQVTAPASNSWLSRTLNKDPRSNAGSGVRK